MGITANLGVYIATKEIQPILQESGVSFNHNPDRLSEEELLMKSTRTICNRHNIVFPRLSTIQRKFVTHYRCNGCGLLPLYYVNLSHLKRVRCRNCGQLIAFKGKGKYGKLRKEIAFALMQEIEDVVHAPR